MKRIIPSNTSNRESAPRTENQHLTPRINTSDRESTPHTEKSAPHTKKSIHSNIVPVSRMCLSVITHQTKCETRRPVVVNVESDYTIYHPFERPPPCRHQQTMCEVPRCPSHGPCCTHRRWRICSATGDDPACDRWQTIHMVISGYHERTFLSALAKQQRLSTKCQISGNAPDRYRKLRHRFFDAGAAVAHWAHAANKLGNLIYKDSVSEDRKDIARSRFETVFDEWQRNVESLNKLTSLWDSNAGVGMMEACASNKLELHPYAWYYQAVPTLGSEDTLTPTQWLQAFKQGGIHQQQVTTPSADYEENADQSAYYEEDIVSDVALIDPIECCWAGQPPPVFKTINWKAPPTRSLSLHVGPKSTLDTSSQPQVTEKASVPHSENSTKGKKRKQAETPVVEKTTRSRAKNNEGCYRRSGIIRDSARETRA